MHSLLSLTFLVFGYPPHYHFLVDMLVHRHRLISVFLHEYPTTELYLYAATADISLAHSLR